MQFPYSGDFYWVFSEFYFHGFMDGELIAAKERGEHKEVLCLRTDGCSQGTHICHIPYTSNSNISSLT
jgi:hypothetical protein